MINFVAAVVFLVPGATHPRLMEKAATEIVDLKVFRAKCAFFCE